MEPATAELIVSDRAHVFTLADPDGQSVSSAELLARGPLIVSLYCGLWSPQVSS